MPWKMDAFGYASLSSYCAVPATKIYIFLVICVFCYFTRLCLADYTCDWKDRINCTITTLGASDTCN